MWQSQCCHYDNCSRCGSRSAKTFLELQTLFVSLPQLGLETARTTWERVGGHLNPAVCILLGLVTPPSGPSCRQEVLEWCVGEGFELVEWGTEEGEGDSDEGMFGMFMKSCNDFPRSLFLRFLFLEHKHPTH